MQRLIWIPLFFGVLPCPLVAQDNWRLERTGIFNRLTPYEIVVTPEDHLFFLDRDQVRIRHYGPEGNLLGTFAGRGEGPGETLRALKLTLANERLYLIGSPHVVVFDLDGNFLSRIETPEDAIKVDRVKGGYLIKTNPFTHPEGATLFQLTNDQFLDRQTILRVDGDPVIRRKPVFSPLADHDFSVASSDGRHVFIRPAGTFHIHIFEVPSRQEIGLITNNDPPIRVTREFREDYARKRHHNLADQGLPPRPLGDFPEFFPAMAGMFIAPDGNLAVIRYSGDFDRDEYLFFDVRGQAIQPAFNPRNAGRILAQDDDWAYIALYDPDREEAGIAKVSRGKLAIFLITE